MPNYRFTCHVCHADEYIYAPMSQASGLSLEILYCGNCEGPTMRRVYGDASFATLQMHAEGGQTWREHNREIEDGARARGDEIKNLGRAELV